MHLQNSDIQLLAVLTVKTRAVSNLLRSSSCYTYLSNDFASDSLTEHNMVMYALAPALGVVVISHSSSSKSIPKSPLPLALILRLDNQPNYPELHQNMTQRS
jgi:hypothetical protein